MRLKGQYNAVLTLSPRLHVKPLITAIRAIPFYLLVKKEESITSSVTWGLILSSPLLYLGDISE